MSELSIMIICFFSCIAIAIVSAAVAEIKRK